MATTHMRRFFGVSIAALLAGISAGPAWAQASTPATAPTQAPLSPAAASSASSENADIVVTAQKRSERLIDVPASVTALSADKLIAQGALRFEDYQAYIPGLSTTAVAPGYNQINIRGITTGANQLSSTVGTYFDEAPTNSSTAAALGSRLTPDPDLLDIARIEVLRGPQGTLYGANALGGVIKYVFVAPELDATHGQFQAGLSTVDHGGMGYVARGAIGAPIVEGTLGVRASGFYTRDPGFINNVTTGRDDRGRSTNWGGRIALLWKPNNWFSATASSLFQQRNTVGLPQETVSSTTLVPTDGRYKQAVPTDEFIRTRYQLHALTLNADLGFATLVSATSYGRQQVNIAFDDSASLGTTLGLIGIPGVPFVSLPVDNDVKKFTEELRLSSPTGQTFEYTLGGYYTNERSSSLNGGTAFLASGALAPAPINPILDVNLTNRYREFAIFANGTLNFTDRLSLQAGGRWSRNNQRSSEPLGGLLFGPLSGTVITQTSAESAWTYAVSPQFKITPNFNVYARVAKGFRPGGANLVLPGGGGAPTYNSDTLINYEAGTKASLFDRRLNFSVAAFRIDWKDIQTTASDALGFKYLVNGGRARSQGVESEARWSANGLSLGANISYTDAKTREAIAAVGARAGDRLPYAPRWAGALTADYQVPVAGEIKPTIGGGIRYTSSRQAYYSLATATNPGDLRLPGYTLFDLRAGLRKGRYEVSVFAENVTDKHVILTAETEFANPINGQDARATIARPRTIGVTIGAGF